MWIRVDVFNNRARSSAAAVMWRVQITTKFDKNAMETGRGNWQIIREDGAQGRQPVTGNTRIHMVLDMIVHIPVKE